MSSENGETTNEDRSIGTEAVDKEDLSHRRKQEKLEDSREEALDMRSDAYARMVAGQVSQTDACRQYRGAIQTMLIQLLPLLDRHTEGSEYTDDVDLGRVRFEPPADLVEYAKDNLIRLPDGVTVPQPKVVEVRGLRAVLEAPSPLRQSWAVPTTQDRTSDDIRSASVQKELSFAMLDQAMQVADEAMEEIGFGIESNEGDTFKIE